MQPFVNFDAQATVLLMDDIDTDQIIPARFLKITDKDGLSAKLFYDWRYHADGAEKSDFILNRATSKTAQILISGANFGCGSSREHAPWALKAYGFRAVIALSFGDIFRNNALKNGLLPIQVDTETHARICKIFEKDPFAHWSIDLQEQTLGLPDGSKVRFEIDSFSKMCLGKGIDEIGYTLTHMAQINAFEENRYKTSLP